MKQLTRQIWFCIFAIALVACNSTTEKKEQETGLEKSSVETLRIVSLKGAFSETLAAFDLTDKIVGVDVTSTYPIEVAGLPKVGHNRNISSEGILALKPTLIVADPKDIKSETLKQLQATGIRHILIEQEHSIKGTKHLISELAKQLSVDKDLANQLHAKIDQDIMGVLSIASPPKVLFIYARGAGTLMVAGEDTQMEQMIELAGGQNAVAGFTEFKPLTSEALVAANPDIVLLFSSGAESLNGITGILQLPGMMETTAGKQENVITMDGQLLAGFGPRVGEAVKELNQQFIEITQ